MRGERHLDGAVHIAPFGVVIHSLGQQRHPRHEAERGIEICKGKFARNRIAPRQLTPLLQLRQCLLTGLSFQLRHDLSLRHYTSI